MKINPISIQQVEKGQYRQHYKDTFHFKNLIRISTFLLAMLFQAIYFSSCKKLISIQPPTNTITTTETFADSTDASGAILGIYSNLSRNTSGLAFGNGLITFYCGLSADELINTTNLTAYNEIYTNSLISNDQASGVGKLWTQAYSAIYQANATIEGLQSSSGLNQVVKAQFIAEAKFLRALCYFYLVNAYGDIPYLTTGDFNLNRVATRMSKVVIYQQLIADLIACQRDLRKDYSISGGERIRANQAAATALLARIYLYMGDYQNAMIQSSTLINNSATYSLVTDLNKVFLKNSTEAILQWGLNSAITPYNATYEGYYNLPNTPTQQPKNYYLSTQLLSAFETGDQRRTSWVSSTIVSGKTYYVPYKYKITQAQAVANAATTEYYMVFRLAEQYLIKAESEANLNQLGQAIADLNAIRTRAGLPNYTGSTSDKTTVLNAIYHERQIELFAEWGHRWFDLKRTGQVDAVMSVVTPQKNGGGTWNSYQQLYPIFPNELLTDPNLKQNPGY